MRIDGDDGRNGNQGRAPEGKNAEPAEDSENFVHIIGSELTWEATVTPSGPLGSLAKPLIEGNVKKIVEGLFVCAKSKLS